VALSTQLLSKQQHNDNLHTKSGTSNPRDYAPDRVTTVFERVDDEHTELSKAGSSYLANASLHGNHGFQAKRGQDIDDVSKHKASIKTNDHSAQAAWMSSDSPGQERTIKNYRDVRAEIDDLEKSIRKCSHRLRTFAANLPTHCPPVHRYGVESFITWCSLSSSSMLGLHEYFEEAHDGRNLEPAFNYRHGVEGVASDRFTTANIAAPIMDESHAWPETIPQDNNLNHVGVDRPNVEWEHLKSPLQHRMEPLKHQQLPSIDTLLNDRQIYEINGPRAETAPFVQLRYDSTARSVNYTRTGRISKAKKGLKVYSCECGRSYTRAEHLRRHQQNHTSDQALVCEYPSCGKVFYRPDLLLRHQERHQESNGEPASPETTSPIHQSSSSHWLHSSTHLSAGRICPNFDFRRAGFPLILR
jgi:hypothetical protein